MPSLSDLQQEIGQHFTDQDLLQQVFIHRSYLNEHRSSGLEHNERLEFLGDAVLELVVTEYLYRTYPNPEGELTTWRSALVKGETLADIAKELNFPEYILLSRGEIKSGGKHKNLLLANAFEALIGALYLDKGYEASAEFISRWVLSRLDNILENHLFIDPKSRLQEYTQQHFGHTPGYEVIEESGPDHAKEFTVEVRAGQKVLGRGTGSSKQGAQIAAAETALTQLISSK